MITLQDLQAAIAECTGERSPNANTCIKLAAFYTIKEHLYPDKQEPAADVPTYSYAPPPEDIETIIDYYSDTEFGRAVDGKKASDVWPVIDELVSEALKALNPRLYDAFMRRLTQ